MGRRKINIKQISDPKLRHITFNKRKNGLIKKAAELAVLCNVNMLLIFEDSNGSLIQFSRDKVATLGQFFKECRYNSVLELTSNDYPNFFKVNHYKKTKEKDKEQIIAEMNEIKNSKNARTYSQFSETDHTFDNEGNTSDKISPKEANKVEYQPVPFMNLPKEIQRNLTLSSNVLMTENTTSPKSEDANQLKKNKNKFGLRLNIQKEEEKHQNHQEGMNNGKPSPAKHKPTIEEQIRAPIERTPVEIIQSPFFTDPFQQFGMLENSPFKFYNANSRTKFINRLASGAEDLSSVLKGTPSYIFPVGGITPMLKSAVASEIDDKLLDTAKIANLLSESSRIFNFQQEANNNNNKKDDGNDSNLNSVQDKMHHLYQYQRQGSRGYFEEIETNDGNIKDLEVRKKIKEN